MFEPRLRKVASSERSTRRSTEESRAELLPWWSPPSVKPARSIEAGVPAEKVRVRGNGFPEPFASGANNDLRTRLGIPPDGEGDPLRRESRGGKRHRAPA